MGTDFVIAVDLNSDHVSREHKSKKQSTKVKMPSKKRNKLMLRIAVQYNSAGNAVKSRINRWFSTSNKSPNIIDVTGTSLGIIQEQISRINLAMDPPDILIQPCLGDLKMFDFDQAERSIHEGYTQAKLQIDNIKMLL